MTDNPNQKKSPSFVRFRVVHKRHFVKLITVVAVIALFVIYFVSTTKSLKAFVHPFFRRNTVSASLQDLNLRLSTAQGWKSPHVNLHGIDSLKAFLSSCNPSLITDACSALTFQKNEVDGDDVRMPCLWARRNTSSGLLRQVEEALIFARLAHFYSVPHVIERNSSLESNGSDASFEWVDNFFGLEAVFRGLKSIVVREKSEALSACSRLVHPIMNPCDVVPIGFTEGNETLSSSDCFSSPKTKLLFSDLAPCLRQNALCHGRWTSQALNLPFKASAVNVIWLVTTGISCDNSASCGFDREVLGYMAPLLRGRKSSHYIIGGADWEMQSINYVSHIHSIISELGLTKFCQVSLLSLSVKDSVLYMMSADVVLSSSSSLAHVAALFSSFPVVITPHPEDGDNMFHYLPDAVYVDGWTHHTAHDRITRTNGTLQSSGVSPSWTVNHTLHRRLASRLASIDVQSAIDEKATAEVKAVSETKDVVVAPEPVSALSPAQRTCIQSKAAADGIAAADALAAKVASWPLILNVSLVEVNRHYIDGWAIKGNDIVIPAVFEGSPDAQQVRLVDALGSEVQCRNSQKTYAANQHRWANIVCSFSSLQDMNQRMKWADGSNPASAAGCTCCSIGKIIALSINSLITHIPPLRSFPQARTAIVLPVIFGKTSQTALSLWLSHNTRVLGVELMIVYSQSNSLTSNREGTLRPFYTLNSGRGVVIVNVPQIEHLETHYHNQHFVINDAVLRSMGSIQYVGCMDADEYLEIPAGHNLMAYLRNALQCQLPINASDCSSHNYAAVGIGSFMISGYKTGFDRRAQALFCKNASLQDYSYLPPQAECLDSQSPEVRAAQALHYLMFCIF
jgi:hypothetical protein